MKRLPNKKDKTKTLLVALNEDDHDVLKWLFEENCVWGYYQLTHISEKNNKEGFVKQLLEKLPDAKAIAYLSSPKGFVPSYPKRENEE